jgi:hypothetical protein
MWRQVCRGAIVLFLIGCHGYTNKQGSWTSGKITTPGKYALPNNALSIDVYLENNFVRYKAFDKSNQIVIHYNVDINMYQNWAFYLDDQKNFWVLSSDVGHSVWKKVNGEGYYHHIFNHVPTKSEVPASLYRECREFFYGN